MMLHGIDLDAGVIVRPISSIGLSHCRFHIVGGQGCWSLGYDRQVSTGFVLATSEVVVPSNACCPGLNFGKPKHDGAGLEIAFSALDAVHSASLLWRHAALDDAVEHAQHRAAFGKEIIGQQGLGLALADGGHGYTRLPRRTGHARKKDSSLPGHSQIQPLVIARSLTSN